ncbi:ATP-binding protein [Streptomyces sp. NPDC051913]|uniref:ATP-binding protein n=1 Tax=Streptomyces sp. NPDC051913 TaxID=3365676 RepID=UPI0037D1EC9E
MTTTAVQPIRAVFTHDRVVVCERFKVEPHCGAGPPREDAACRVGAMRRLVAARLGACGVGALVDEAMLIVSELLTNALVHSGTSEVSLNLAVREGFLVITVVDGMPGAAQLKQACDDAESGRGLELVAAVAEACDGAWGTSDAGAKTWCFLALPAAEEQR